MPQVAEQVNVVEELHKLEDQRDKIQGMVQEAQSAMDLAKADLKKNGTYADANWFAVTKTTIREKTNELHNINRQIKQIKIQMSRSNPKATFFQEAARKLLPRETYDTINATANEWMAKS